MAVKDSEKRVTVAKVDLMNRGVLHVLAPALHLGLAEDETFSAAFLDVLVGVGLWEIHTHVDYI